MRSLLLLAIFVTACGQMGPLVLPDKSKPAPQQQPPPPSAPDDVERQKKQTVGPTP